MTKPNLLSNREEAILTCVGYLVMRWNYAEWSARQILRKYVAADSIDDPEHLKVSARMAKSIEDELRNSVLPKWTGLGRKYLEVLLDAYAIAREHRNHFVHGIYATFDTASSEAAQALLIPSAPKNKKTQVPTFTTIATMRPIAEHFHDLAMFARDVMAAFDERGERALNPDRTPALDPLPSPITPLEPCQYETT